MTTLRRSPDKKNSIHMRLLSVKEYNFSNKFMWKLPEISKNGSVSPIFSPMPIGMTRTRYNRMYSVDLQCDYDLKLEQRRKAEIKRHRPELMIEGTTKLCNKQYFRKTYLAKIWQPKKSTQRQTLPEFAEDCNIRAWEDQEVD